MTSTAKAPKRQRLIPGTRLDRRALARDAAELSELAGATIDPALAEVFLLSSVAREFVTVTAVLPQYVAVWHPDHQGLVERMRWCVCNMLYVAKASESPIEKLMCWAMRGEGLAFEQQIRLGDFVADFVIGRSDNPPGGVVVECDGHEHHTTRERQARDRRIDRELQKAGYAILRFTGSQITTDPNACAAEVREFIQARAKA